MSARKAGRRKLADPVAKDHAFGFVPEELRAQCHRLVVTFHEIHGYACLPDMLWKAGLAGFISWHRPLNDAWQNASTARSARRANEFYVIVAGEVLALEVLARDNGRWSLASPLGKNQSIELLEGGAPSSRTWLIEQYLYPSRTDGVIAAMSGLLGSSQGR